MNAILRCSRFSSIRFASLTLGALTLLGSSEPARADVSTSLKQGFNFKADVKSSVGCIESLQIDATVLAADISTKLPTNPAQFMSCVAVLSQFTWKQGPQDPLSFEGNVSATNRALLTRLAATSGRVTFRFVIFENDTVAKVYFVAAGSHDDPLIPGTNLLGLVQSLSVSPTASSEVRSPQNYPLTLQTAPAAGGQAIYLGTSATNKMTKRWGL